MNTLKSKIEKIIDGNLLYFEKINGDVWQVITIDSFEKIIGLRNVHKELIYTIERQDNIYFYYYVYVNRDYYEYDLINADYKLASVKNLYTP